MEIKLLSVRSILSPLEKLSTRAINQKCSLWFSTADSLAVNVETNDCF